MKDPSLPVLQFSGSPFSVANSKPSPPAFIFTKRPQEGQTTFIQASPISNDPVNWDLNWFGDYE